MIPAVGRSSAGGAERERSSAAGGVLVVDEASTVRSKLVEILGKLGALVGPALEATTADEALRLFHEHRPRIVFAELVGMHPEDGLEVVLEILERAPETRVVLVTAEPREGAEVRAAIRAGVFAIVEKPIRYEKIRAALADLDAEEGGIERLR